jgi:predicted HicB family RNase H-like nuclease
MMLAMKSERLEIVIPKWLKDAVKEAAKSKGISMAEYIKDTLKNAVKADSSLTGKDQ